MSRRNWHSLWSFALVVAGASLSQVAAQEPPPKPVRVPVQVVVQQLDKNDTETPAFWLGIALSDATPALLAQLKIAGGVVVEDVVPDSPAAKAGVAKYDVIVKAGDADIKTAPNLLKAVGQADDKELVLVVVRDGKQQSITTRPVKRPEDQIAPPAADETEAKTRSAAEEALRLLLKGPGERDIELEMIRPGVLLHVNQKPLPDDVKITVERQGKQPAKVTVSRGGDSWGATGEKEIDTLPEEYREHARAMLGLPADHLIARGKDPQPRMTRPMRVQSYREDPLGRIEQEIKQLRQEVEELRRASAK